MLDWLIPAAQAAEAGAATGSFWSGQVFLIAALGFAWYFMLFRPHLRRQKAQQALMGGLKKGDKIVSIGGIHGTPELERRVDAGEAIVAFSLYPTTLDQLMAVADASLLMPPKSTWFEPKLRDGLLVNTID